LKEWRRKQAWARFFVWQSSCLGNQQPKNENVSWIWICHVAIEEYPIALQAIFVQKKSNP
jgi:hypothetical protein